MELHSENKGRLGDKFEGFQHPPSDAVWDRIAATPTDRPLGARFRMFAVVPNPRVWRRIAAQLQPQQRRVGLIWWSAAAGIALLIGFALFQPAAETPFAKNFALLKLPDTSSMLTMDTASGKGTIVSPIESDLYQNENQHSIAVANQHHAGTIPIRPRLIDNFENGAIGSAVPSDFGHLSSEDPIAFILAQKNDRLQKMTFRETKLLSESMEETYREMLFWQTLQQELDMQQQAETALLANDLKQKDEDAPQYFAQAGSNISGGNGIFAEAASDVNQLPEWGFAELPLSLSAGQDGLASSESDGIQEEFRTPLIFGAYLDRHIAKGFGISGGLVYTKLQSSAVATGANLAQRMDITRQYLGLAASGTYTLPLGKHFATYASTGLQFDQGLGRHRVLTTRSGETVLSREEERDNNGVQMSANLGLGIRYNILKRVGLYAQGTAAHYFLQSEENLWTTKKVWPMMQVGVRVNL